MLTILGSSQALGSSLGRRKILQAGSAGLFGIGLPEVLHLEASASDSHEPRCKSVIMLFLFGGPSQLETFDMKPEAPDKIRGPYRPISSKNPDLRICEHLPRMADLADKYAVIRTMSHTFNDHSGGAHYLQTGKRWHVPIGGGFSPTPRDWPSMGSIVEYVDQQRLGLRRELPSYMVVPNSLGRLQEDGQYPRPGEHSGWLGQRYNPLTTRIDKKSKDDNPYWRNCTDEELNFRISGLDRRDELVLDRLESRQTLLSQLNRQMRRMDETQDSELDVFRQRAFALATSNAARNALDIRKEPDSIRDLYGRHLFGQSTLMARRLIESGIRFVTVQYDCVDGYSWDSHRNSDDVGKHLLPTFDQACSALLVDLQQRGMLDETLVIAMGEMGRTPTANAQWGRDHWSTLFPAVIAGGGVRGGNLIGKSDKDAAYPIERPVSPEDLAATVYYALGIDPEMRVLDFQNRPTPIVDGGRPVLELWS
ncbi:MAG: DUF1501 domain-containing protein [Pirellula sp.]